jgi:predicted metalloprotease with PDZ domain
MRARRRPLVAASIIVAVAALARAQPTARIVYTVRAPAPESHYLEVEATFPSAGREAIDLMMPVWSPGYYRVEPYAERVDGVSARSSGGDSLAVEHPQANRWRVRSGGASTVTLSYRVFCNERTVTTNYVGAEYGVINGAPTFITLAEAGPRPHEVRLELPRQWPKAVTGLDAAPDGRPNHFLASDYETLVDSPILAGHLVVQEFGVAGKPHYVAAAGDVAAWNAEDATRDLARYVEEVYRFWGFLPYDQYAFLLVFRPGGGGLEHKNSTLSTVAARPGATSWAGIGLLSHEYFHLYNVKRLRPVELGPFDFERPPRTGSLWIAEGVTSYYSGLLLERAGLRTRAEYLSALSQLIAQLQGAPGRLSQSVEQSSLDVWNNSNSGVNPNASTVSYYNKGEVLGLLLDAKIRRATDGRRSLDDVMRRAYERFSGARGYTADEFRSTAEEVSGLDLRGWFRRSVSSAEELDYTDLLECYGLRFADEVTVRWKLEPRSAPTESQQRNLAAWLTGSR